MIADHDLVFGHCRNKEPHSSGILLCCVVVVGYENGGFRIARAFCKPVDERSRLPSIFFSVCLPEEQEASSSVRSRLVSCGQLVSILLLDHEQGDLNEQELLLLLAALGPCSMTACPLCSSQKDCASTIWTLSDVCIDFASPN